MVAVLLVAAIVFIVPLAILGRSGMATAPYYGYPYYGWWFFFPFGFFFFVILIFVVSRLIFWPWGWGGRGRRGYWYRYEDAREILRQRYARGELTKDQYEQMMRDLEQHP